MAANNFCIKKRIVQSGGSSIFENWKQHSSITMDDFLEALEWVCGDQFDENNRRTRWIGLEPDRIVKLKACYGNVFGVTYVKIEDSGKSVCSAWNGAVFEDGFFHKIMLSARDKV